MLNELEEAKRFVKASIAIKKMHDETIPDIIENNFQDSQLKDEKTSNGIVIFSKVMLFYY